jgi:hypothetical protein
VLKASEIAALKKAFPQCNVQWERSGQGNDVCTGPCGHGLALVALPGEFFPSGEAREAAAMPVA